MRKTEVLVFFTLFLTLISFRGYAEPVLLINGTSIPSSYNTSFTSQFFSIWGNSTADENITSCNFTLGMPNGTLVIYNATYNSTIPVTLCYKNFTQDELGPAGNYNWSWAVKNSTNHWAVNDTFTFTLNKTDPSTRMYVELNGTNSNISFSYPNGTTNVTASKSNLGDGGCSYNLYRNDTNVSPTYETALFKAGLYYYTYNTTACENYTSSSIIRLLNISRGNTDSYLSIYIDGATSNKTILLPTTANIFANESVSAGEGDIIYTLWRNNTQLVNGSDVWNQSLSQIGVYKYTYNATGGENWTSGSKNLYLFVTDLNYSNNITSQNSPATYSANKNYGFSIKWTGNLSKVIFESNFNGTTLNYTNNNITITNWNNNNLSISNDTNGNYWINFTDLPVATYSYRWIANDTNNIWTSAGQQTYTISPLPVSPSFTYSGSGPPWTAVTSTSVTLSCSATPYPVTLSITGGSCSVTGGNSISCAFTTGATTGSASYTCSITSSNHTGSTSGVLSWAPFQSSTPGSTTTPTQNTTGSFTITSSSYSVTMEPNTSKTITLTLTNAFSYDIININLSVSGIDSSWYTLEKTNIIRLRHDGGTNATLLTLKVPSDAERKIYSIVFTASGKDFSLNKITRQTTITLTVPSEQAQNETQDNQTQNQTQNETNATANETNITTGSNVNENNNFLTFLTGLLIKPEYFRNIVLFVGLIAVGLVFLFRSNITEFLTGSLSGKSQTKKEVSKEKKSLLSSIKNKFSKYSDSRIVIHVKKEEKEKKEKV